MNKNDMQMQILQMLFNDACNLKHMPKQWRDDSKKDDDIYSIRRICGRGTMDNRAAEHFNWLDDDYDYCERHYDCYNCVYECPKFEELSENVKVLTKRYQKMYPSSEVEIEVDGFKSTFYLDIGFTLSEADYRLAMDKLEKKKIVKKDGGITMSDRGREIVEWLQGQSKQSYSASEIAEGLFCSSRAIPGAMKKLINDGLIEAEKIGSAPNQYKLTDKGVSLVLDEA